MTDVSEVINRFNAAFAGPPDHVRGVNLMRVRDGLIVEALGYSKSAPREAADA
ncbi:hypothetical protein [Lentzea indica]|uniref:hypothetical protein n=1 Tax=Lentzea indica TaxID=2604800 RepID=UPI001CB72659|nr:hypothetical protein [Lentzea indica]